MGKVERMIRMVNERLRTNRNIIVQRDTTGISNILFALRSEKGADNKSAFEKQMGRTPNTIKSAMIKCILEEDPKLQIEPEDFSEEADSTILVRERVRGTKLEGNFKKMKGRVTAESEHTITVQPKAGKPIPLSKRDVATVNEGASTSALRHNEGASTSAPRPIKSKKAKMQKVAAAKKKPVWEQMAEKEYYRGRLSSNEGGEKEERNEQPEPQEGSAEANSADESTIPANEEKEMKTTESMEEEKEKQEEKNKEKKVPVKGQIKWEKVAQRSSTRTQKKPNWLGNNIMVTKIEQESRVGESLPSVYEIPPPQ